MKSPLFLQKIATVPDPINGSRTTPSSGQVATFIYTLLYNNNNENKDSRNKETRYKNTTLKTKQNNKSKKSLKSRFIMIKTVYSATS